MAAFSSVYYKIAVKINKFDGYNNIHRRFSKNQLRLGSSRRIREPPVTKIKEKVKKWLQKRLIINNALIAVEEVLILN